MPISALNDTAKSFSRESFTIQAGNFCINLGEQTKIMGIVNLTPDSFSGDGHLKKPHNDLSYTTDRIFKMIDQGADIIDVGGESSRPGALSVDEAIEIERTIPAIKHLAPRINAPISIDTYKPSVAKHALDSGASIVNNIMGTSPDQALLKMIRNYDAAVVLMHMRGRPKTMQENIAYQDVVEEIIEQLQRSIESCLEIGIKSDKIMIDPGIGFGKTVGHNLEIIHRLSEFQVLNQPVLIGMSRKSFIGKILNQDAGDRLTGSLATASAGVLNGAHVIRAHDVKETKHTTVIIDAILKNKKWTEQ